MCINSSLFVFVSDSVCLCVQCIHRELCRVVWRPQAALFSSKPSDRKQPRRTHISKTNISPSVWCSVCFLLVITHCHCILFIYLSFNTNRRVGAVTSDVKDMLPCWNKVMLDRKHNFETNTKIAECTGCCFVLEYWYNANTPDFPGSLPVFNYFPLLCSWWFISAGNLPIS